MIGTCDPKAAKSRLAGFFSDTAIKDVENSNHKLVDNMGQVSAIVNNMNNCISDSSETSKRMVSRYTESAENINEIEEVIEALDKAKRRLDANVNFDLTMELLMLEIKENG